MRGEVALVTGGSSGIGLALAKVLAAAGARVFLVARNPERLRDAELAIGGDARGIAADLARPDGAAAALAEMQRAGAKGLDVLANCAGQLEVGPAAEGGPEVATQLMDVNYLGTVRAIDAALPLLRRGRRRSIVNVSSMAARVAPPFMGAYAASKFALNGYTYALRQELRPEGFHVGLVHPGPVMTPMIEGRINTAHYHLPPGIPIVGPERVARAIVRLIERRQQDCTVPGWLGPATRIAAAFPASVDLLYRLVTPARSTGHPTRRPSTR
jgi:NAD(P)-dependent dehydrogenase (short-subunit alcohol dehydrogenase family)